MNRLEFEAQLIEYAGGEDNVRPFTEDDYVKIEYVYIWHPAIKDVGGKRQIAIIWQEFGMGMIDEMYPAAQEMGELLHKRDKAMKSVAEIDRDIRQIKDSYN